MAHDQLGDRFAWINGMAEPLIGPYAVLGADAMTSGLVNFAPHATRTLWNASREGQWDRVRVAIAEQVRPFAELRAKKPGYSVAVIKEALAIVGRGRADVRPPLGRMDAQDRLSLEALLLQVGGS